MLQTSPPRAARSLLLAALGACTWISEEDIAEREDLDGDGALLSEDCDDGDPSVYPGADEVCGDGLVNDCDGSVAEAGARCVLPENTLGEADAVLVGEDADGLAGWALAVAGDVDGDGAEDVIVGVPGAGAGAGAAVVAYGPFWGTATLSSVGSVFPGPAEGGFTGQAVAAAGDLDADGYADVLVGAPDREEMEARACGVGAAWLMFGPVGEDGVADADGHMVGPDGDGCFGHSVAGVGDLSGDGLSDLVVGEPGLGNAENTGTVYLLTGAASESADLSASSVALVGGGGQLGGYAVASAGDVDGDGSADLIIGGPGATGAAWVLRGPVSADLLLEDADSLWFGATNGTYLGSAVATAGDADGDGRSDLVVGARYTEVEGMASAGAAWLVVGSQGGNAEIEEVATAQIVGTEANGYLGYAVGSAGDLDGDGASELLLSAPFSAAGATNGGAVYWLPGPLSGTVPADSASRVIVGQTGDISGRAFGVGADGLFISAAARDGDAADSGAVALLGLGGL